MPVQSDRVGLEENGVPVCPYCGCTRHDSERQHAGNVMKTNDLLDAMLNAFLLDPEAPRRPGIWPADFPDRYPAANVPLLRAKMEAALGVAVRNMVYLAALRTDPSTNRAEEMRGAELAIDVLSRGLLGIAEQPSWESVSGRSREPGLTLKPFYEGFDSAARSRAERARDALDLASIVRPMTDEIAAAYRALPTQEVQR